MSINGRSNRIIASQFAFPRIVEQTEDLPRDRWLALRKDYIGGSDAAASLGLSKFKTISELYEEKVAAQAVEREDTEKMWAGRKLEPVIAEMFAERTGKQVVRQSYFYCHPVHSFMGANIDFAVVGENAGLECKNTSSKNIPEEYHLQCHHYMAVTGASRWYLAYLLYGWKFDYIAIERDDELIDMLISGESDFWDSYVIPARAPLPY